MADFFGNAGSVLGQTGTGAAAGAAVGGPWGAVIGGGLGALGGIFGAISSSKSEADKRQIIKQAAKDYNVSVKQMQQMLNDYYESNPSIGTASDVNTYKTLVSGYDPNKFVYDYKDFDNDYDINDYYAPNRSAVIQKTADTLQSTAAGSGIGRGTGAANMIATGVANKNEELAKGAQEAMNQDRQFAYQLWNAAITQGQNRLDALRQAKTDQLGLYGDLAQDWQNFNQQKVQSQLDLLQDAANNKMQLTLASI